MLDGVEWGEFKLGDLFEKIKVKKLNYKASELPNKADGIFDLPALTAGIQNQGLNNYVPRTDSTILSRVITVSANGANTGATFFQKEEFTVLQDSYAINWIYSNDMLSDKVYLFFTGVISKAIYGNYEWTNKAGWEKIKSNTIQLPIKNDVPDFNFMENFMTGLEKERITKLKEYLTATGLNDYTLTSYEEKALEKFNNLTWSKFNLKDLFGEATRGKRLKSDDRIPGNLPFVTAGESEEGVSAFIGNSVEIFSENTITIDMFGSAKYRNYKYGGDDHIAVVHTNKLPKYASIFITSAIHKTSYTGEFHYGRNFYAKDADNLHISLPTKNEQPDYETMETLISAIHKLIIKDVVLYVDGKTRITVVDK